MAKQPKTPGKGMSSGADAALKGFAYQVKVSIFAALRLLLIDNAATRLTLEPANEEDLEADMRPDVPGRVVPMAVTAQGYRLVIQVKLTDGDPWSVAMFARLLKKGVNRTPAKTHLDDPTTRYLLVTTADASGVARGLLMTGFEDWPAVADFPKSLKSTLTKSPEGRVGILGSLKDRGLDLELDALLGDLLRVPAPRRSACLAQLDSEARQRMSASSPGVWTRDDLQAVIRTHGGYVASSADRDAYVEPANFDAFSGCLDDRNAVVLTGPSGTGKTATALALCDRAREQDGDVEIVIVNSSGDPAQVRDVEDTGPRVYYIEDPWGQNSLRSGSEAWTAQLPRILRSATPRRQFIVTSRSDMLQQAKGDAELQRWCVPLEAKEYADGALHEIYNRRMDRSPNEVQSLALKFRDATLRELQTPLELDLFFSYLADGRSGEENDQEFIHRLLGLAHRDAVEGAVRAFLRENAYDREAIVIWAILGARGQVDRHRLALIDRDLRRRESASRHGVMRVTNRLVATRHLRQPTQTLSFAHPSVRAGFEILMQEDWAATAEVLDDLLEVLSRLDGEHREWGMETAARILLLAQGEPGVDAGETAYGAETDVQNRVDVWLEEALLDPASDFGALIALAADVGSSGSTPSELSRWFMKGVRRGASWFMETWTPPVYSEDWYVRVAADPRTRQIAARYVREQLPRESQVFTDAMPGQLDRLATGLEADFIVAAHAIVGGGHELSSSAIAAGAVRDLDGFRPVVEAALDFQARMSTNYRATEKQTWREIEDGEHDEGFAEHFQFQHEDEGYVADVFIKAWIAGMRTAGRWQDLDLDSRVAELANDWALVISYPGVAPAPTLAELRSVFSHVTSDWGRAAAWRAVSEHWDPALRDQLIQDLVAFPDNDDLRRSIASCAATAEPNLLVETVRRIPDAGRLVQLAIDLRRALGISDAKAHISTLKAALASGPAGGRELLRALPIKDRVRPARGTALALTEMAAETAPSFVLGSLVKVLIKSGQRPIEAVARWLHETTDARDAANAAEAAVELGEEGLLIAALGHPRASARRVSLVALGTAATGPLAPELLALAYDKGSGVRLALAKLLKSRPEPEHMDALVHLTGDTWSDEEPFYDSRPSFPIARHAVAGLGTFATLSEETCERLIDLGVATRDADLRDKSFDVAAERGSPAVRLRMWTQVVRGKGRLPRRRAILALAGATTVENSIIEQIKVPVLLSGKPRLVAALAFLLGRHAPAALVVSIFTEIFDSLERRALTLIGAAALFDRDPAAADKLMDLLGAQHPARALLTSTTPLDASVLNSLGNIEFRQSAEPFLAGRFAT